MDTTSPVDVGRRRIIKRPRLTRMLDESGARIILLVAPAGYGKTTLAHEWLDEKRSAWYRASTASADVAALAVGLASATAEIVPGAGDRMRQRLRATDRPEEEARTLAEMLAEDLGEWPDDAWLVIDDYHLGMESPASEAFVGTLVDAKPLCLVITTRRRPIWATGRLRLYGQAYELDRTLLAMSDDEALDVLTQRSDASELVNQAAGWPAVIGLAALTLESRMPSSNVPAALYDYFAEELLGAEPVTRLALCRLSVVPCITAEAAVHLLGPETAPAVLAQSVTTGILQAQPNSHFDLHPLLRTFLQERLQEFGSDIVRATVKEVGAFLLDSGEWDDALSLAERFRHPDFLEDLIERAWETLLDEGRLATLSRLLDLAAELRLRSGLLDLVDAEIAFRQAAYRKAEALALESTRRLGDNHLLVRAYTRAGQSAHLEGRDQDALGYHRRAQGLAHSEPDRRESLWGEFVCSIELEEADSLDVLRRLEKMGTDHATDAVRIANGRMLLATRHGTGTDPRVLSAVHRLPKVDDPLVRSSFRHVWSCVLTMTGRYREALEASEQQLEEAEQYRLAFVLPLAYTRRALALRGLRRFREALECLNQAQRDRDIDDDHIGISASSARIGIYIAIGNLDEALKVPEPSSPTSAAANVVAELTATRALAYACAKRPEDARVTAQRAYALSTAAEPRLIAKLAKVVTALQESAENSEDLVRDVFHDVMSSANADAFVTAYRGFPRLLLETSRAPESHARLVSIVSAASDLKIARAMLPEGISPRLSEHSLLTAREKDILALVSQGLRNREIAQQLFISEVTVKTHVRNILKKLGARSRTHAVSIANRES